MIPTLFICTKYILVLLLFQVKSRKGSTRLNMYIDYRRVHGEVYVMRAECMKVLMLLYKAKKNEMLLNRMSTRPLPPPIGGQRGRQCRPKNVSRKVTVAVKKTERE